MNFGPQVGRNAWGGPNIGKRTILRTQDPGNTVPQAISRTLDPGNTGSQSILRTLEPGSTGSQAILRTLDPGNTVPQAISGTHTWTSTFFRTSIQKKLNIAYISEF